MTDKVQLIKQELERLKDCASPIVVCDTLLNLIDSLPEEPKFKVGDMVISTNNSSLTYKVLQVGLQNELGKLDYEVEIFTNGKPGIKVGNTFKEHNIRLICCDRMDEWGKLFSEEHNEDLEEEINRVDDWYPVELKYIQEIAHHFVEWQKQKDFEELLKSDTSNFKVCYEKGRFDMREQMMKDAVEAEVMYPASSSTLQIRYKLPKNTKLKYGDKVKIIILKTE